MFCFKCGAAMPGESPNCPQCGAAVSEAPQPAPRAPLAPPPVPSFPSFAATPQPYAMPPQTDGKATASMVLGILSLFCLGFGVLLGIPAVILGHMSKSNIRKSGGRLGGDGMATAGLVMGYVSIALLPILLAITLPNILRSRSMANETSAQAAIRTVNTAEVSYSITYPTAGFARNLAALGPDSSGVCAGDGTQQHACLLDSTLGCGGAWCVKNNYQFQVTATCGPEGACTDYVVVAVPLRSGSTGTRSFCSTSDGVLRTKTGVSVWQPPTVSDCQTWTPA